MILSDAIRINHFPAHRKALNIEMSQPNQKAPDGVFKMLFYVRKTKQNGGERVGLAECLTIVWAAAAIGIIISICLVRWVPAFTIGYTIYAVCVAVLVTKFFLWRFGA